MNELFIRRSGGQLFPQFLDVAVDGAVADGALIGIDPVHELGAGVDAPRVGGQEVEQLELHSRQFEVVAMQGGQVAGFVQDESLGLQLRRAGAA